MRRHAITSGLFLVAVVAIGCDRKVKVPESGPLKVVVAKPVVTTVTQFTELTGTLAPVKTADIRPQVSGPITKVYFKDGDRVNEGDKLVQIDPRPFVADVQKSEGELANAKAKLKLDTANEERIKKVWEKGATSKEEYDQAVAQKEVSAANVISTTAALEKSKLNLSYTDVKAPFSGRIDRIYVNEGNVVTGGTAQGTVLTTIVTVDPMYAYFDVDEQTVLYYIKLIREKKFKSVDESDAPLEVQLKGEQDYPHTGILNFVSNRLNPATGSLQIRGEIRNPGPPWAMTGGMFVRGRIPATVNKATLVPEAAIVTDQDEKLVYVVDAENRVKSRKVELGALVRDMRIIEKGVGPEDRVIIRGVQKVIPDVLVEPTLETLQAPDLPPPPKVPPTPKSANPGKPDTEPAPSPKSKPAPNEKS